MSKFNSHLKKLAAFCTRHKFIVERTAETTQGTHSFFEYGQLGAEMRRNLTNLWWHEVVTSKETISGVELSIFDTDERFSLANNSSDQHRMFEVESLTEKLISFALENKLQDKEVLKNSLNNILSNNSIPIRTESRIYSDMLEKASIHSQLAMPGGYAWYTKDVSMETNESAFLRNLENDLLCLQFFCEARTSKYWFNYWRRQRIVWWRKLANDPSNFSSYDVPQKNGVNSMTENQYNFPWSKEEIESISCCSADSNGDVEGNETSHLQPSSIQITTNLDKGFIALLADAFEEKDLADMTGDVSKQTVLHLHPSLAPYKVALYSNMTDTNELTEVSNQLASELRHAGISTSSEHIGSTAEQFYAHHDEIGTPYCVTILQSTLSNGVVALRNRDTTLQEFLHISDVLKTLQSHTNYL